MGFIRPFTGIYVSCLLVLLKVWFLSWFVVALLSLRWFVVSSFSWNNLFFHLQFWLSVFISFLCARLLHLPPRCSFHGTVLAMSSLFVWGEFISRASTALIYGFLHPTSLVARCFKEKIRWHGIHPNFALQKVVRWRQVCLCRVLCLLFLVVFTVLRFVRATCVGTVFGKTYSYIFYCSAFSMR